MVLAIRVILPFSMYSSRDCCWRLLKYWISSKYNNMPLGADRVSSSATSARISAVEALVPLSRRKARSVRLAIMDATVVLPTPGGP